MTNNKNPFRTELAHNVFYSKYAHGSSDSWRNLSIRLVDDVCGRGSITHDLHPILSQSR